MTLFNNKKILRVFLFIIFLFIAISFTAFFSNGSVKAQSVALDDGWNATVDGQEYPDINISSFSYPMQNKGDIVTYERILDSYDVKFPVLRVYSIHSIVEVYLDDQLIYEYGRDYYEKGTMLGYGMHYIELPDDYAGKDLRICFTVTENNAFDGIQTIYIMNATRINQMHLGQHWLPFFAASFLIFFGLISMVLILFIVKDDNQYLKPFCVSMFSFLIGLWTLCNYDLITCIVPNLRLKVYLEYISIYTASLPFLVYFRSLCLDETSPKWMKNGYRIILDAEIGFIIIAFTLHLTNIAHFPRTQTFNNVLMIIFLVFISTCIGYKAKENHKFSRATLFFVIFVLASVIFEVLRYNVSKYVLTFNNNSYSSMIWLAVLVMVIALFMDYLDYIQIVIFNANKQEIRAQLAYEDELTGLYNRRKLNEAIESFAPDEKYTFISVDLNLLKYINDNFGHDMGDDALIRCAGVLQKAFSDSSDLVCRTGGDEFIVLRFGASISPTSLSLEMLRKVEKSENDGGLAYTLSMAVGTAYSTEIIEATPDQVLALADKRMYACKKAMKMERKD